MRSLFFAVPLAVLLAGILLLPSAYAQFQSGGVDKDGEWYAGEGLKQGDYFSYRMCHVEYKECVPFVMNFWIAGETGVGTEYMWRVEAEVRDGSKRVVGEIPLAKFAPEPTGSSPGLAPYKDAFKSSIVWMTACATQEEPKEFRAVAWCKIANIGGEQIRPTKIRTVTVPAGTWEAVAVSWRTGGQESNVWIADGFPFPIKASTFTHVNTGIPPQEYDFELLDYKEDVQESPFEKEPAAADRAPKDCPQVYEKVGVKKPTEKFQYQVHAFYGPEHPVQGCPMQWTISFINKVTDAEFLNQVQYDLFVVDEDMNLQRSIADEEGRQFLYSPSGQSIVDMVVNEEPGTAHYVVWIYGLAPKSVVPSTPNDYIQIDIPISAPDTGDGRGGGDNGGGGADALVPPWVKTSAGWWADGQVDDSSFIQGMQYLITEGIMRIPATAQAQGTGSNEIPSWVKTSVGWWADGQVDDSSFIQGMQYLITEGIMRIPAAGS